MNRRNANLDLLRGAAVRLVALPPGGWGETVEAENDIASHAYYARGSYMAYVLPGGRYTNDPDICVAEWVVWAMAQPDAVVHPDRRIET